MGNPNSSRNLVGLWVIGSVIFALLFIGVAEAIGIVAFFISAFYMVPRIYANWVVKTFNDPLERIGAIALVVSAMGIAFCLLACLFHR